jgi:hypothetical protein
MKDSTAQIYHKVIKRISKTEKISIEEATEIVDKNEVWLIDMVEAFSVKLISYLATCIYDFHCDGVNN